MGDETVELHVQTNNSTKHSNETGQKIQGETNKGNSSYGSSEKRNDRTKNENEQKESKKRKPKNSILPPCSCKSLRIEKIDSKQRSHIHSQYWKLDKDLQKNIYFRGLNLFQKRTRARGGPKENRKHSRVYSLKTSTERSVSVCAKFFLANLGFKKGNIVTTLFKDV